MNERDLPRGFGRPRKTKRRKTRACPACDRPARKWERVLMLDAAGRVRSGLVCTACASQAARIVNMSKPGTFTRCEADGCTFDAVWCSVHGGPR